MCTRSREARLRDEPSTAENSGAGKQARHGNARVSPQRERKKAQRGNGVKSRGEIERGIRTTL